MPRCRINVDDLPARYQEQVRAQLDAMDARRSPRQPQPTQGGALVDHGPDQALLVNPPGTITVRIVRVGGRVMDDDNLAGAYKPLRDAIAAAFGRRGDSEDDGFAFKYAQEAGPHGTRVEVYP